MKSSAFVHRAVVMQLQSGGSGDDANRFAVLAHLSYDMEDPFAVTATFSHDGRVLARWRLAREMLAEGLRRPVGEGDVRFSPRYARGWHELRMDFYGEHRGDGERHHAVVHAWAPAVERFLEETYRVVAPGDEQVEVDSFLSELLANG
ncbi:SsgA family sporulation/cell division regulator [Streptomyces sp. NPDC056600]|uniref:SsgA family sporulation/cell division regulator n=1 Tax=Streptomyces sp. NPDC056600 TaxID=3345874 RepID=UPI0036A9408E